MTHNHTKEQWETDGSIIWSKTIGDLYGYQIAIVNHDHSDFPQETIKANAQRIVDCVNLCQGYDIETLKKLLKNG
jgi:hypothetical protein